MEVEQPNSKLLHAVRLLAIAWVILWCSLALLYYYWFRTYNPISFKGFRLLLAILVNPSVLMGVIAIPEILVFAILAHLRIEESLQWRKVVEGNSV